MLNNLDTPVDNKLILIVDSQKGDFRGFEGPFNHLTNGPEGAITVLKEEGRDAVAKLLSEDPISYSVLSLIRKYPRSAKTIAYLIGPPYAESHIQAILDAEVKEGSAVRFVGTELPPLYTTPYIEKSPL